MPYESEIAGIFLRIRISTWQELISALDEFKGEAWCFRGQGRASDSLASTLERTFDRSRCAVRDRLLLEDTVIQRFRRQAHHYYAAPPSLDERFDWWALLRHHGAPSRLLDVTHSPYVATYFAFESSDDHGFCSIWAFDSESIGARTRHAHRDSPNEKTPLLDHIFGERWPRPAVWFAETYRMNERMAAQQGAFLVPATIDHSFEYNLFGLYGEASRTEHDPIPFDPSAGLPRMAGGKNPVVVQICADTCLRREVLRRLRLMNITAATLYPGLDGFARSIGVDLQTTRRRRYSRI